jgi:hypothetical protein
MLMLRESRITAARGARRFLPLIDGGAWPDMR